MRPSPTRSPLSPESTSFVAIRYEPIAEIGSGGMGTVVLSRASTGPTSGAFVAIKRMFPHLEREAMSLDAFFDEVWLTSVLHHPHVIEPLDWGRDEQGSYLVLQFVPGDSLRALVRSRELSGQPVPVPVAVEILARAAEGLHAAHELKSETGEPLELVHRDVSPANLLVGYDGSVKLIDFGVAKAQGKLAQTQAGLIKGKYSYMSPEQIRGHALDRRSDIFSLGIVGWELLTLQRLYSALTEFEIRRMVCDADPVAPSVLRREIPEALSRIIVRCLAKRAADRFASGADLARELAPWRPPRERAPRLIATLARESMPERLAWIERVTGTPISVGDEPPIVSPDLTTRTEPVSETVGERLLIGYAGAMPGGFRDVAEPTAVYTADVPPMDAGGAPRATPSSVPNWRTIADKRRTALLALMIVAVAAIALSVGAWLGMHRSG